VARRYKHVAMLKLYCSDTRSAIARATSTMHLSLNVAQVSIGWSVRRGTDG